MSEARKRSARRLSQRDRSRVVQEQMERPSLEYHTDPVTGIPHPKRIPISRVIKTFETGLSEADLRLRMLKMHVEIAMAGSDPETIQRMIDNCETKVRKLHETSGSFGDRREQLVKESQELLAAEADLDRLHEVERLSDIRRMTNKEREAYKQNILDWIKVIERRHEEEQVIQEARMKRQRKEE